MIFIYHFRKLAN